LVEEADKITHNIGIDDELECEEELNFFKFDELFATKEIEWDEIKKEIVGEYFDPPKEEEKESGSENEVMVSKKDELRIL
jgi:pre-mRNA-splicing factor CWC22